MSTAHARQVRDQRTRALRGVDATSLRGLIDDTPEPLLNVPVHSVLAACPGIGPVTCRGVLERVGVWPLTPLGQLIETERQDIIQLLSEKKKIR